MRRFALAFLMTTAGAHAATVFSDDFQSGKADIWKATGKGDVRLTTYEGNVSLRLMAHGAAIATVSTKGYRGIAAAVSFAGLGIEACEADVSVDGGETWIEIHRIGKGQDDGISMHPGGAVVPGADDKEIYLALRNTGEGTCWADNVKVRGQAVAGALLPGQLDMGTFAPPEHALAAKDRLEGRLVLGAERPGAGFTVLRDEFGDATANGGAARHLPPFDFEFVQSGDVLIPARRGAIASTHPAWEFVLEPGRVWRDGDASRASLPFALEERNANCMHNGVLSFRFNGKGAVSDANWQIASETCRYFKFDLWGSSAVRYVPGPVEDAARIAAGYEDEIANRRPTKPIAALASDYPGADPAQFGSPAEIDPDDMTMYGVVAGGTNYVSGCMTRMGPYPFCAELTLPSYSLAKSLFAGVASMRLSLLYPGVMSERIADHVPQCASAKTWGDVTFANSLDMASGHYISRGDQVDEDSAGIAPFFAADTHAGKIDFACNAYPRNARPGTQWVYHTADTYALGTAERDFFKGKTGGELYPDALVKPLWHALHLDPAIDTTRTTYDAVQQPFTGYGLTLHRDDMAKLADFLNVDGGRIAGTRMLDPKMLGGALQRDPASPGLEASTRDFRYHNGFWAWNAQSYLHCKSPAWIAFMSGYGGIAVALMPNGITYYYFSDGGVWAWARAAAEADRIKPFCER